MKAIDTNILIRFLVGDDVRQSKIVYSIFKKAELEKKRIFYPVARSIRNDLGFRVCL